MNTPHYADIWLFDLAPLISTPFSNTAEIPYYIKEKNGDVPYAYHHLQDFTSNIGEFQRATENAKLTQNVDSPEAGLDALMQAIVCKGNCCLNSCTQRSLRTLFIYWCILGHWKYKIMFYSQMLSDGIRKLEKLLYFWPISPATMPWMDY